MTVFFVVGQMLLNLALPFSSVVIQGDPVHSERQPQATLFGISHILGIVQAFRHFPDFLERPTEIPPWSHGSFSVDESVKYSFVCGWWNKTYIGEQPFYNPDGTVACSPQLLKLMQYIDAQPGHPIFIQLASVDAYAAAELVNLGPYDIEPRWDFSLPGSPSATGRCPVRKKDVDAFISETARNVLAHCIACKNHLPDARFFYVFPPPPVESEDFIINQARAASSKHPTYAERYQMLLTYGVRPFTIRHKLISLVNDRLRALLHQEGVGFVDPPSECLLPSGALDVNYARDMHHGNDAYNQHLLSHITSLIQQKTDAEFTF